AGAGRASSPAGRCRRRTGSPGSTSPARRSSATDASFAPTRTRSRETIGPRREDSRSECLAVDARARHRRRAAGRGRARRALPRRRARGRWRDQRGRAHPAPARRARARGVPARLPPALAVLPPDRARGGARRGLPLPRSSARLAILVRELPRELSAAQLGELFSGQTHLVERLAGEPDPLRRALEIARAAPQDQRVEALAAHPRIGEASPEQRGEEAEVLAELAELNRAYEERFGFRFVVFVSGRERHELVPVLRQRLERTREQELETGLEELVAIAR